MEDTNISPEVISGACLQEKLDVLRDKERMLKFSIEKSKISEWDKSTGDYRKLQTVQREIKAIKKELTSSGYRVKLTQDELCEEAFDTALSEISQVEFHIGGYLGPSFYVTLEIDTNGARVTDYSCFLRHEAKHSETNGAVGEVMPYSQFLRRFRSIHIGTWRKEYRDNDYGFCIMDGTGWELSIHYRNSKEVVAISGCNAYPYNFNSLLNLFNWFGLEIF